MLHYLLDPDAFAENPAVAVFSLLGLAFTVWMLVDAYRRGAEFFWYFVIFFLQPIGTLVYFFAVFLPGFRLPRVGAAGPRWQRKLSLDELRYRTGRAPTVVNRMALAERLMETGAHREAIPLLDAVLAVDGQYCPALHDLARCHVAVGEPARAVPVLRRLIDRDRRWSDYRAWRTLIEAHDVQGQPAEALAACRELEKMMPTLENKCRLAERLIDTGHRTEAADLLDRALEDLHYAPVGARWRNWRWAREARRLLKEADAA